MTQKTDPERFTCPGLTDGARVAVLLDDGTLAEGYWHDGAVHDEPRKPAPSPAPWRIHKRTDGWTRWTICKQHALDECEPWCYFETSTEAFEAFAKFEPGVL